PCPIAVPYTTLFRSPVDLADDAVPHVGVGRARVRGDVWHGFQAGQTGTTVTDQPGQVAARVADGRGDNGRLDERGRAAALGAGEDRKSTRLNSRHVS